ncbi:MAG: PE family protein [Mycobacterium sp.]|nr:MAG: PE family protein [Mycobacterium sp.]
MPFVSVLPEFVAAAAADLATISSSIGATNVTAALSTSAFAQRLPMRCRCRLRRCPVVMVCSISWSVLRRGLAALVRGHVEQ